MTKTKVLKVDPGRPDEKSIDLAAEFIKNGKLVAFPTETVYGIGADYSNEKAIERLYEIKQRPRNKPFTVHVNDIETVKKMGCEISPFAGKLMNAFWPGPLTVILPCRGAGTLGFRMPSNRIAKALIEKSGVPVVAPSANLSGEAPPVEAGEILKSLNGKIDLVLDGGRTELGEESTIIDATAEPYKILRQGAVTEDEIKCIIADSV